MVATNAALASGGIHPLLLAMRLENVFFSVRPIVLCHAGALDNVQFDNLLPRADAGSIWQSLPGPERGSARSVLLPPRRRKSAAGRSTSCICGPTPPRTLPRPAGAWSARQWRCWCPAPRRSGCRSSLRPHPICPPSTGCAAFVSSWAERLPLRINSLKVDRVPPRVEPDHVFLDGNLFPGHGITSTSLPCRDRDSEIPVMINDGGD